MNTWNAGQILTQVRTMNRMDIDYLGPDTSTQNQTLFGFMNICLWNLPRLAYLADTSDPVTLAASGPVTFTKGNAAITNMYEPLRLLGYENGLLVDEMSKRPSYTYPVGWWREAVNQPVDVNGAKPTATYKLAYLRYPSQVTQESDAVDIAEAGYKPLIMAITELIKWSKNFYSEAEAASNASKLGYNAIAQAAIAARGASAQGQPPSYDDVKQARGG